MADAINSAGVDSPWLRRIEVEFQGLLGSGSPLTMISDGTQRHLNIRAVIQKDVRTTGIVSSLWIYNLDPATTNSFVRSQTRVRIKAGWDEGPTAGLAQVFDGTFLTSQTMRQGPDIVTELFIQSGRHAAVLADVNRTWSKAMPVRAVVLELAKSLEGVGVDPKRVRGVSGVVADKGLSLHGDVEAALNRLGRQYGFYWSIIDNLFQTVGRNPDDDGGVLAGAGAIEPPKLISARAVLTGIRRIQRGVAASCAFDPTLSPGYWVTLNSDTSPEVNGDWRITRLQHNLSAFESASFVTTFEALGRKRA